MPLSAWKPIAQGTNCHAPPCLLTAPVTSAGTHVFLIAVGPPLLALPPLAALVLNAGLMALTHNPDYCATQLLMHPLSQRRLRLAAGALDIVLQPPPSAVGAVVSKSGGRMLACLAGKERALQCCGACRGMLGRPGIIEGHFCATADAPCLQQRLAVTSPTCLPKCAPAPARAWQRLVLKVVCCCLCCVCSARTGRPADVRGCLHAAAGAAGRAAPSPGRQLGAAAAFAWPFNHRSS